MLFPQDGRLHRAVDFVPDQSMDPAAAGEAVNLSVFVLPDASGQVGCHADVERSPWSAGRKADAGNPFPGAPQRSDLRRFSSIHFDAWAGW